MSPARFVLAAIVGTIILVVGACADDSTAYDSLAATSPAQVVTTGHE
jgi:hypothetical protein